MSTPFDAFLSKALSTEDYRLIQLAGDASARKYFRVISENKTWVLMSWDPFRVDDFPFLSVHRHFQACGIQVPEVITLSESEGLILLEDLGDLTLERKFWENQSLDLVLPYYEQSLDELVKIHFETQKNGFDSTAVRTQFDTEKFLWEFNYAREHFLEKMGGLILTPTQQEVLQTLFVQISERLHHEPKWVTHRDYHSRNLMIKLDQIRVIDFQDARRGPLQYDLVSLLRDSYVNLSDETIALLMKSFWEKSARHLPGDFSFDRFSLYFELQTIQRCFKACGSFSSFWNLRRDTRYLKYISPTLKRVLKALFFFPEYREFGNFLLDSGLLEKKFE